jgi:hypothetical protein
MMDDLIVWVMGWNKVGNEHLAHRLRTWGEVPHVETYCNYGAGEAQNYNYAIRTSEAQGYGYILIVDADVEFIHPETIPEMYKWLTENPKAGSIRPWRKGEAAQSAHYPPPVKYVDDGTAMMWRLRTGMYYDEEFQFTGWSDLDAGLELEHLGYLNYNDRRYPVMHDMTGSNSHVHSSALNALKKRNKLILDFKWFKVGREKWQGVEAYNDSVTVEYQIPTVNQIIAMPNESQEIFGQSISPEHHQIWVKDSHEDPNLVWMNPLIVGYSTRDKFEKEHGYS